MNLDAQTSMSAGSSAGAATNVTASPEAKILRGGSSLKWSKSVYAQPSMLPPKRLKPSYNEDSDITTWRARHVSGVGWVEYELNEKGTCIWILMLFVRKRYRGRGVARAILRALFMQMQPVKGWIIPGTFTDKGEPLMPWINQMANEYPGVEVCTDFFRDYERYLRRTPETIRELQELRDSLHRRKWDTHQGG